MCVCYVVLISSFFYLFGLLALVSLVFLSLLLYRCICYYFILSFSHLCVYLACLIVFISYVCIVFLCSGPQED